VARPYLPYVKGENNSDEPQKASRTTKAIADVVYAHKKDAKYLKVQLEGESFLNKDYRMFKADPRSEYLKNPSLFIALPVTQSFLDFYTSKDSNLESFKCIVAIGKQVVPYSSKVLGQKT